MKPTMTDQTTPNQMTDQMTDQTTPNQMTDLTTEALTTTLTNVTPEVLAASLNNNPALKKKLATALCCETIEDLRELVASVSDTKADGRRGTDCARGEGKMALPFAFIGKMQKFFIPNSDTIPDVKTAYRQNVVNYNQIAKKRADWDGYTFRMLRKENGALLVKIPSPQMYTWGDALEEYALYDLTPRVDDYAGHGRLSQKDFTSYRVEADV